MMIAVKNGMDSQSLRQKMENDENKSKRSSQNESLLRNAELDQENDKFIHNQRQRTKQAIQQQDENLDILGSAVDRLGVIGKDIKEELIIQNKELDNLGQDIDHASDRMNIVMASLEKLLKTKDGCQIWTIVILALILIILGMSSINTNRL